MNDLFASAVPPAHDQGTSADHRETPADTPAHHSGTPAHHKKGICIQAECIKRVPSLHRLTHSVQTSMSNFHPRIHPRMTRGHPRMHPRIHPRMTKGHPRIHPRITGRLLQYTQACLKDFQLNQMALVHRRMSEDHSRFNEVATAVSAPAHGERIAE